MIKANVRQVNHYFDKVNAKKNNNNNNIIKTNVLSPNPVTIYKLRPTKKIIVRSPQPDDIGKLTKWDKICKNEKINVSGKGPVRLLSHSVYGICLGGSRSVASRLWDEGCPRSANHQHEGYWWLPYHPTPHERLSAPLAPSCLPSLLRQWALGGFARLE